MNPRGGVSLFKRAEMGPRASEVPASSLSVPRAQGPTPSLGRDKGELRNVVCGARWGAATLVLQNSWGLGGQTEGWVGNSFL